MDGSIALRGGQRKRLLALYRTDPDPHVRLRAHLVLLLADGRAWALIAAVLFCSTATITRWKRRFEVGGVDALRDDRRGRPETACGPAGGVWMGAVVRWATNSRRRSSAWPAAAGAARPWCSCWSRPTTSA